MNKSEITKEILSQIKIEIDETLFYMPGETIKGTIKLFPGFKLDIKDNILHFKIKLVQYEFWDYTNLKANELKNVYKTEIKENLIEYKLKEEESPNYDSHAKIGDFSLIIIEKEETDKFISIPFEFELDKNNEKLLPTFQFETNTYFLGIRHLLIFNSIEFGSINYIGLFIGKTQNKDLIREKNIINNYYAGLGNLDIKVNLPKQSFYFGEKMPFIIESKSNLLFKKVTEINADLSRTIEWTGYLKNTLMDKKTLPSANFTYNHDKYRISAKIDLPFQIMNDLNFINLCGNGILGIFGIASFIIDLGSKYLLIKEILRLDAEKNEFNENEKISTKFNKSLSVNYNEKELKEGMEELKKFVYFRDKKVVGFVKFVTDITPPVHGYYFNCDFHFKIKVHFSGLIYDQDKTFKTDLEFYDGEDYIKKMKQLFKS